MGTTSTTRAPTTPIALEGIETEEEDPRARTTVITAEDEVIVLALALETEADILGTRIRTRLDGRT